MELHFCQSWLFYKKKYPCITLKSQMEFYKSQYCADKPLGSAGMMFANCSIIARWLIAKQ